MSDPKQVKRSAPLRDQVHAAVERMIIHGDLPAGGRLVESELATRLGVSRNPVREALTALARDGWVEVRPRQGSFVRTQSQNDAQDCFRVRCVLEVEASRQVAERMRVEPGIVRTGLQDLRALVASIQPMIDSEDQAGIIEANSIFHRRIVELTGSRLLIELIGQLDKRVRWYFGTVAIKRAQDSWREHAALLDAIDASEAPRAMKAMEHHIGRTSDAFRQTWATASNVRPATDSEPDCGVLRRSSPPLGHRLVPDGK